MALDIFALLTSDGDHAQADHMFTGKAGDMVAVADVLDAVHWANRRLRAVPALASLSLVMVGTDRGVCVY